MKMQEKLSKRNRIKIINGVYHKLCSCCGIYKEMESSFAASRSTRDGYRNFCIHCIDTYKRDRHSIYNRKRFKTDINYKITILLRNRLKIALQNKGITDNINVLIGCTNEYLKTHLQKTAIDNGYNKFDINNYNGEDYHIDHIKPCSSFNLINKEDRKKCFHYSNLQILSAKENIKKSDKIIVTKE